MDAHGNHSLWEDTSHASRSEFSDRAWGGSWGSALSCGTTSAIADSSDNGWGDVFTIDVLEDPNEEDEDDMQPCNGGSAGKCAGLLNLGNTCFLNSVLQCLTYTVPFANSVKRSQHKSTCHVEGFCAMCALEDHIKDVFSSSGSTVSPSYLASNLSYISNSFVLGEQQDAHEYFFFLMEVLQKCCMPASSMANTSPKSFVSDIFIGRLRSQVQCKACSQSSDSFEDFLGLSLEVESCNTVLEALHNFTAVEALEEENKVSCSHCKNTSSRTKQLTFEKAPQVLAVHLKRFKASSILLSKIERKIDYESSLDLRPFMSKGGNTKDIQECKLKYNLYAVLVHSGWSTTSGHYFCFVRTSPATWHCMNDSVVSRASEKTVLRQEAYVLFYIREDIDNTCRLEIEDPADISSTIVQSCKKPVCEDLQTRTDVDAHSISASPSSTPEVEVAFPAQVPISKLLPASKETTPNDRHTEVAILTKPGQNTMPSSLKASTISELLNAKHDNDKVYHSRRAQQSSPVSKIDTSQLSGSSSGGKSEGIPNSFQNGTQQSFMRLLNNMPSARRHALLASAQAAAKQANSPTNKVLDGKRAIAVKQQPEDKIGLIQKSGVSGKRQDKDKLTDLEDKTWMGDCSTFGTRKLQRVAGSKRVMASFVDSHA